VKVGVKRGIIKKKKRVKGQRGIIFYFIYFKIMISELKMAAGIKL
jgi:hypothetical protein